ncbi:MAG: RecB-like helicase, partial [Epsilonproteobacteria bacterium]|nr:RecB-like helicase [Campylobacterota bacterium]
MAFHTNMAYEASAGSGKTFALVIRYISLLYLGAKPNTILALTFTNKAANEMAERINKVLRELDQPSRAVERSEISRNTGLSEEVLLVQKERIYHTFLQSDLKISTIDKFFSQILRKFSLNLALMPDFQIEENSDEVKLIEQFLQQTKKHDRYIDLIKFAAIESKKLGNIFSLLENLYAKDGELQNITIPHVDYYHEKEIIKQVKTLEALFLECEQLSQSGKNAFKFDNIDDLLKKTWLQKQSCAEYTYFKKCFTPQADILLSKIKSTITDYLQNKDAYLKSRYLELYQIYKETKRAYNTNTNKLSFNDVSNNVFDLLRNNIHSDFLYFRLDAKIDHILIDEFQDTNVIQYKILEPILDEISAGIGTKAFKTLFYVGDIKQSIYRFRGGAKELFHHTASAYGIHLEALTTNYRSDAKIVSFVNESFRSLIPGYKDQQFKGDPTLGYVQVSVTESLINEIVISVQMLTQQGVQADNIAILTYANSDAFIIEEALLQKDPTLKITTQTTAKLINASMVSAIIELLKYLYFQDPLYKVNFLTKIGLSWDYDLKLEGFSKHQDLTKLVKRIIENFKLYSHDDSLLKFLEVISHYKDIESFLFESEELTIDSPSKQERGIKILTIHKSKGLEFDHVIIADRFKRKSIDRSSFIFSYNN